MAEEDVILGRGTAPGKVILFGEHAVVYDRPAIAVPVARVRAEAWVTSAPTGAGVTIRAPDLARSFALDTAGEEDPLAAIVRLTLARLALPPSPDWTVTVRSTIPMEAGMGSGAAVSAAIASALAAAGGRSLAPETLSELVYQVERLYHGTPSGIDNTVVSYARPVYFRRGHPPRPLEIGAPFWLVIGDTGVRSATREVVAEVRRAWRTAPGRYEALFDRIAALVEVARSAIERGDIGALGPLMDENQRLLAEMGVSSPELERLIAAARGHGASGAKLVGAGRGGNMIALVEPERAEEVARAVRDAGAVRVLVTPVGTRRGEEGDTEGLARNGPASQIGG